MMIIRFLSDFLYKSICLYKEVDIKYTGCNLKTMELLYCALIGACAVIRSIRYVVVRIKSALNRQFWWAPTICFHGEIRKQKQEAHGPRVAHLSDIATADMQMLCNIFPILSSQLMKRSSFKQFFILKKKIYSMPVNWAWLFEQTLNGSQLGFTIGTI